MTEFIKEQSKLADYIAKTLGVKRGIPMTRLIKYLRNKSAKAGETALQSLTSAKEYFNNHQKEAKQKYDEYAKMPVTRKKPSNPTTKKSATKKPAKH